MPIAHVRFKPEELADVDALWLLYDSIEQMRCSQAKMLQQSSGSDRQIHKIWLKTLTVHTQETAAGIVVGVLQRCYRQDISLYTEKDEAPLFSE